MLKIKSIIFFLFIGAFASSQDVSTFEKTFEWKAVPYVNDIVTESSAFRMGYQDAYFSHENELLPVASLTFPVNSDGILKVDIIDVNFLDVSPLANTQINITTYQENLKKNLRENITFTTDVSQDRQLYNAKVFFNPITYSDGQLQFVSSIKVNVRHYPKPATTQRTPPTDNSILSEGQIFKLKIKQEGVHKITGAYIADKLGVSLANIDVSKIQVFSNPGGKVALNNSEDRVDDLNELSIAISGITDGKMDAGDAIYFYSEAAEAWIYDKEQGQLEYNDNPFDIDNYAYIRFGAEVGKRIATIGNNVSDVPTVTSYRKAIRYELNNVNLLENNFGTLGTGQEWFGEYFDLDNVQEFSSKLSVTNVVPNSEANLKMRFAGRATGGSAVKLSIGNQEFTENIGSVILSNYQATYAKFALLDEDFPLPGDNPTIIIDYSDNASAEGWLDYIDLQYERQLLFNEGQLQFNNEMRAGLAQYNMTINNAPANAIIWEVSDIANCTQKSLLVSQNSTSFTQTEDQYRKFVMFDPTNALLEPEFVKEVANQNLHSITSTEMIIVVSSKLRNEAERLATHRAAHDNIEITIVDIEEVYNEFSGGRQEPTAIRDFFKMVYDRGGNLKYGLLFGNGSYDYRGIKIDRDEFNIIPVFETRQSIHAIYNFPSDDYFGLLSNQDGESLVGDVDLAIGRIPVYTVDQAKKVVEKIIKYDTDPTVRGPWNLRSIFVADDEDSNAHITPSDDIAENFVEENSNINPVKIYFDSYPQVSTPGGERYPTVTDAVNGNIYNGGLTCCYLGHGGPTGWAQERVLQLSDIENWANFRSFPLFVTATCSLSSFDDPEVFSAGEKILVSENGGIALFTTSRAVFASDNTRLTKAVFKFMLEEEEGELLALGEILRRSKNDSSADTLLTNARKFMLLGDPSMKLLYPKYDVVTTSINGTDLSQTSFTDTINALSKMRISGIISYQNQKLESYNGEINVTVFDKRTQRQTLVQDPGSRLKEFQEQKNIIFKGKAKVTNGDFDLEFVVPKDILFKVGNGKISYYATNGVEDAKGNFTDFLIGGSSANPIIDDTPPLVEVFMNNEQFVFGGLTDEKPFIYAKITDDIGINLSGASVGHDLTGKLDNDSDQTYFLNDYFESELNNFSKGFVKYPLNNLENGRHVVAVRAWDVANNVGEGFTEFVVSDSADEGLAHVLNYPNPFTDNTCFMFEHNLGSDVLDVQIDIFTVSGKLVKTILHNTVTDGYRVTDIKWDGNDDFGSALARGVYLYKIKINAQVQNIKKESGFEKLVILK